MGMFVGLIVGCFTFIRSYIFRHFIVLRFSLTIRLSAILFYLPLHKFEKNEIEKFGILVFDVLFIRYLRIIPEGEICPYSENNLDFMNIWQYYGIY